MASVAVASVGRGMSERTEDLSDGWEMMRALSSGSNDCWGKLAAKTE